MNYGNVETLCGEEERFRSDKTEWTEGDTKLSYFLIDTGVDKVLARVNCDHDDENIASDFITMANELNCFYAKYVVG